MNSVLYHNLSEILGIEQMNKLTMKLEMVRFFVSTTLKHVQIGKSKDKQAFSNFKKMLMCIQLVQDNFMRNSKDFERIYDIYKECVYENFELYENQGNENLFLLLSQKLKIVFESMDLLNKLYHDAKKHRDDNDTLTTFEHMAFQVPISA